VGATTRRPAEGAGPGALPSAPAVSPAPEGAVPLPIKRSAGAGVSNSTESPAQSSSSAASSPDTPTRKPLRATVAAGAAVRPSG